MENDTGGGSDQPTGRDLATSRADGLWDPQTGVVIPDVLPERALYIHCLVAMAKYDVVRFEYELIPGEEPPPPEGAAPDARAAWEARAHWWVTARDNLGNDYDDRGGTYRNAPDGSRAEGELDLYSVPSSDAVWLDITFHRGDANSADHPRYTLRANLPLPDVTLEEWTSLTRKYWILG
jgi:hypothetical protein